MKPAMTRWKMVPSKWPSQTYWRKFATVSGATSASFATAKVPWVVSKVTTGLPPPSALLALRSVIMVPAATASARKAESRRTVSLNKALHPNRERACPAAVYTPRVKEAQAAGAFFDMPRRRP